MQAYDSSIEHDRMEKLKKYLQEPAPRELPKEYNSFSSILIVINLIGVTAFIAIWSYLVFSGTDGVLPDAGTFILSHASVFIIPLLSLLYMALTINKWRQSNEIIRNGRMVKGRLINVKRIERHNNNSISNNNVPHGYCLVTVECMDQFGRTRKHKERIDACFMQRCNDIAESEDPQLDLIVYGKYPRRCVVALSLCR